MSYISHVAQEALENENFRRVLFTGQKSQLVIMSIPKGGEVGEETHHHVEQTLFFLGGKIKAILDDEETEVASGDVVVVTPGTKHNFVNIGEEAVKIYTVYAPANHLDGRVHESKKDADADVADEDFGESVR